MEEDKEETTDREEEETEEAKEKKTEDREVTEEMTETTGEQRSRGINCHIFLKEETARKLYVLSNLF